MIRSSLPPTTHTLEMEQVADLNARLTDRQGSPPCTAATLGMVGAPLHPIGADGLADAAVLVRVSWQGSPEFPDVYGHFRVGRAHPVQALLHTAALNRVAHHLGVRQRWGVGPVASGSPDEVTRT